MVRFSADIMPKRAEANSALLQESLDDLVKQTNFIYLALIDEKDLKIFAKKNFWPFSVEILDEPIWEKV